MSKKVTLKDVAREAAVSSATASYVLNRVSNQTITEETKRRVLEAAKKLNYVQNLAARSLVKGKTDMIGVLFVNGPEDTIAKSIRYGKFIDELERLVSANGQHLMISQIPPAASRLDILFQRKLDGAFLIDPPVSTFPQVAQHIPFGSPLIVIDGVVHDPLFRKIVPDFKQIFEQIKPLCADRPFAVVHDFYYNQPIMEYIVQSSGLPRHEIYSNDALRFEAHLQQFIASRPGHLFVVLNEFLACRVADYCDAERVITVCTSECGFIAPKRSITLLPASSKAQAAYRLLSEMIKEPLHSNETDQYLPFTKPSGLLQKA